MGAFMFRPAVRENVGLWMNLVGGTGSGKTFTGFRLASGMCGGKPFAVIDTENRRALHYADQFKFDHTELRPPFRPAAYADAVVAADKAGYPVIMIDSGSHVWAGDGGVLDWQEEELDRMAGTDWKKREACKMAAWIKPKMAHKQMVQKLLQVKAHILFCLRAEPKIEMVKGRDGKMEVQPKQSLTGLDGWIPVCEKSLPFEATASFLLMASRPGVPLPIKLQSQHRALFPLDKEITEESGRLIAAWATGTKSSPPPVQQLPTDGVSLPSPNGAGGGAGPESAAAQGNGSTGGDAGPESPPASAVAPVPDAKIVEDVDKFIAKRKYQSAADTASLIADDALRGATLERIAAAYKKVAK
jgi:hypothetical protein